MSQSPNMDETVAWEVAALETLAQVASPEAIRTLRDALKSSYPIVRQVAATSLGRIGNPIAVPYLIEVMRDPSTEVRRSAIWALGQIGHPGALHVLQTALRDPDGDVRRTAVWALSRMEGAHKLPGLIEAQADEDYLVRRSAGVVTTGAGHLPGKASRVARNAEQVRRRWLLAVLAAALMVIIASAVAAIILWSQPLGPALVAGESSLQPGETPPTAVPAGSSGPQCGGPPVMKLMAIGLDNDDGSGGYSDGAADIVRVARIDFATPGVILLGIPRDLWVTIPGLESHGISEDRIKLAYPYGNVDQVPGGGPSLLAQTLSLNLGLQVDRYAATDFASFEKVVDLMGGVDINLPKAVGDEKIDPPYFPAGWIHMDGKTALSYARVRPGNSSDLARMDRQNLLISAIRAKLTSSEFLPRVPGLLDQMRGSVATNLSPSEISSLLCIADKIPPDRTSTVKIDKPLVLSVTDSYGYERLLPDQDAVRAFVRAFDAGDLDTLRKMAGP